MVCKNCSKKFTEKYSKWSNGDFCSKDCARSFVGKQPKGTKIVHCVDCNKKIEVDKRASDKMCKCKDCRKNKKYPLLVKKEKIVYRCLSCGKIIEKNKHNKCFSCFQKDKKEEFIRRWKNKETYLNRQPGSIIREYLFEKQKGLCAICKCKPVWNDKSLIFILDHIDGKSLNQDEENLRLICPNCDTQLPTYKSKNKNSQRSYDRNYRRKYYKGA